MDGAPKQKMTKIVKCGCGRRFPFNPEKHRHHKFIYCPRCKAPIKNPSKPHFEMPSFNLSWIKTKLQRIKAKREAKKFLDRYFKVSTINPKTGKPEEYYAFPLNKWMSGSRPTISQEQVKKAVGYGATEKRLIAEAEYLEKLGVKIK